MRIKTSKYELLISAGMLRSPDNEFILIVVQASNKTTDNQNDEK